MTSVQSATFCSKTSADLSIANAGYKGNANASFFSDNTSSFILTIEGQLDLSLNGDGSLKSGTQIKVDRGSTDRPLLKNSGEYT
jgi:hypothetical protein